MSDVRTPTTVATSQLSLFEEEASARDARPPLDVAHHGGQLPRRPDVTLFVDENGHASYTNLAHPDNRFLGLTGVAVRLSGVADLVREMDDLKLEHCGTTNAVLHVEDIRAKKGPFSDLRDEAAHRRFDRHLLEGMTRWPFTVFSVCVDKQALFDLYGEVRYDAYHYAMEVLLSGYVRWLEQQQTVGTVVVEARGNAHDRLLEKAFAEAYDHGTEYVDAARMQARLTSRALKAYTKRHNVAGLQLADLAAYPVFASMRRAFDPARPMGAYCTRMAELLLHEKVHTVGGRRVGLAWVPDLALEGP